MKRKRGEKIYNPYLFNFAYLHPPPNIFTTDLLSFPTSIPFLSSQFLPDSDADFRKLPNKRNYITGGPKNYEFKASQEVVDKLLGDRGGKGDEDKKKEDTEMGDEGSGGGEAVEGENYQLEGPKGEKLTFRAVPGKGKEKEKEKGAEPSTPITKGKPSAQEPRRLELSPGTTVGGKEIGLSKLTYIYESQLRGPAGNQYREIYKKHAKDLTSPQKLALKIAETRISNREPFTRIPSYDTELELFSPTTSPTKPETRVLEEDEFADLEPATTPTKQTFVPTTTSPKTLRAEMDKVVDDIKKRFPATPDSLSTASTIKSPEPAKKVTPKEEKKVIEAFAKAAEREFKRPKPKAKDVAGRLKEAKEKRDDIRRGISSLETNLLVEKGRLARIDQEKKERIRDSVPIGEVLKSKGRGVKEAIARIEDDLGFNRRTLKGYENEVHALKKEKGKIRKGTKTPVRAKAKEEKEVQRKPARKKHRRSLSKEEKIKRKK